MGIFTAVSSDDEFPKARVALMLQHFAELSDERDSQRIMYPLQQVLLLVTCATICSCDDFDDIELRNYGDGVDGALRGICSC